MGSVQPGLCHETHPSLNGLPTGGAAGAAGRIRGRLSLRAMTRSFGLVGGTALTVVATSVVLAGACAPGNVQTLARPQRLARLSGQPCTGRPPVSPGSRVFSGSAAGPLSPRTIDAARIQALTRALGEIATTVGREVRIVESEIGDDYRYEVVDASTASIGRLEVRGARSLGQACIEAATGAVRAFVAVPDEEWLRLKIKARGATLLLFRCRSDPPAACDEIPLEAARMFARRLGLTLISAPHRATPDEELPPNAQRIRELGRIYGASQLLIVDFQAEFLGEQAGEFYSRARAHAWVADSFEATAQPLATSVPVKGGHYSRLDASRAALGKASKRLILEADQGQK